MKIRAYLNLSIGLTRNLPPHRHRSVKPVTDTTDKLAEPSESRSYRRKILTLSGIIVLTGLAGGAPQDLIVFGVEPASGKTQILGAAVILVQLYWELYGIVYK